MKYSKIEIAIILCAIIMMLLCGVMIITDIQNIILEKETFLIGLPYIFYIIIVSFIGTIFGIIGFIQKKIIYKLSKLATIFCMLPIVLISIGFVLLLLSNTSNR